MFVSVVKCVAHLLVRAAEFPGCDLEGFATGHALLFEPPDFVTDRALFTPPAADQPQFEQPQYRLPGRKPPDLPKHRFGQQFVVPRPQSSMRRLNVQRTEAFAGS